MKFSIKRDYSTACHWSSNEDGVEQLEVTQTIGLFEFFVEKVKHPFSDIPDYVEFKWVLYNNSSWIDKVTKKTVSYEISCYLWHLRRHLMLGGK